MKKYCSKFRGKSFHRPSLVLAWLAVLSTVGKRRHGGTNRWVCGLRTSPLRVWLPRHYQNEDHARLRSPSDARLALMSGQFTQPLVYPVCEALPEGMGLCVISPSNG